MPDLVQPVVGFRVWRPTPDGQLVSSGLGDLTWEPGVNRAECRGELIAQMRRLTISAGGQLERPPPAYRNPHEPPGDDCGCGLYSFHSLGQQLINWNRQRFVLGAVIAWGAIEVHRTGFRAEFARIIALALPDIAAIKPESRQSHERIAARYGVRLVPVVQLEEEARRHGIAVPEDQLPEEETAKSGAVAATQMMQQFGLMASGWVGPATCASIHFGFPEPELKPPKRWSRLKKFCVAWDFGGSAVNLAFFVFLGRHWLSLAVACFLFVLGIYALRRP